jgi:hypothetical protein
MTRRGMVELLTEVITSPPEKTSLDNPLREARCVKKEGENGRSLSGQGSVNRIAN